MLQIGDLAIYFVPWALALGGAVLAFAAWRAFCARRRLWRIPGLAAAALAPLLMAATVAGLPIAPTNAIMQAYPSWQYLAVLRLGVNAPGDAAPMWFIPSATACGISGGDIGSQVPTVDAGCFTAAIPAGGADVREWGAATGGSVDASAAWQAAINFAASTGVPLLPGPYSYLINTGLVSATGGSVVIDGAGGHVGVQYVLCPAGVSALIANSNINLLTLNDKHDELRDICVQMATAKAVRTAGAAITVGAASISTINSGSIVERVSIINPYDGIVVGGPTTGATQTNGTIVVDNTIAIPTDVAIKIGPLSSNVSTTGVHAVNNQISCNQAGTPTPNSIGVALYDGAVAYDGGNVGPYDCNYGTALIPGTAPGGGAQRATGTFTGVLGDTPITASLLIDPATPLGAAVFLQFTGCWASENTNTTAASFTGSQSGTLLTAGSVTGAALAPNEIVSYPGGAAEMIVSDGTGSGGAGTYNVSLSQTIPPATAMTSLAAAVLIANTGGGADLVHNLHFSACALNGDLNAVNGLPIVDLENDVNDIAFAAGSIATGGGNTTQIGILDNSAGSSGAVALSVGGVSFMPLNTGALANDLKVTGSGDRITFTNNPVQDASGNEINWPVGTSTAMRATIANNGAQEYNTPTVVSATSITLAYYSSVTISGTTTIQTILGWWAGRKVLVHPSGSFAMNTGGTAGSAMCASYSAVSGTDFWLWYSSSQSCWSAIQ